MTPVSIPFNGEQVSLYMTGEPLNFIKQTQEHFVYLDGKYQSMNDAEVDLVAKAKNMDSSCNVIYDISSLSFELGGLFIIIKGKATRA